MAATFLRAALPRAADWIFNTLACSSSIEGRVGVARQV